MLPPVRPRESYDDVPQDSLVYALFLNPAQQPDPVDTGSEPEPVESVDPLAQKIDRLRPRRAKKRAD